MSKLAADPRTLSHEAYVYLYPLVLMEVSRRQQTAVSAGIRPSFGPANEFHHLRAFPDAGFRAVVRPNFDTLYSSAWLDLTRGPVRIHVPDSGGRYYMLPMLDMWTDVFANPGARTTGTTAQEFLIVGPGSEGGPAGGATVIPAPTPYVWIIGRTQTNGPADYQAVNAFQDGLGITAPQSESATVPTPDVDTTTEPLRQVQAMAATAFFALAASLLKANPPHGSDFSQLARIADLGLVPGQGFDAARFGAGQIALVEAGVDDARRDLAAAGPHLAQPVDGWISLTESMGVYGNDYRRRAVVGLIGLGANPAEDAVYPLLVADAAGRPVSGDHEYVLHFDADQLPPADAFWSVTMYDAEGYQAANELDRFAIGDRDPLVYNPDGSLDLVISHTRPDDDQVANWLPAPAGPLGITMRLYAPRRSVLDRTSNPPPLRRID